MITEKIIYTEGRKYQLRRSYHMRLPEDFAGFVITHASGILDDGNLTIYEGYAWNGPSGPTFDTPDFMRGPLVHDFIYDLIQGGYLNEDPFREFADRLLRQICIEDGMPIFRANYVYFAVKEFGSAALAQKEVLFEAP